MMAMTPAIQAYLGHRNIRNTNALYRVGAAAVQGVLSRLILLGRKVGRQRFSSSHCEITVCICSARRASPFVSEPDEEYFSK
jgi:hypothetical protein